MADIYSVSLSSSNVATRNPFIYMIYSSSFKAVYIGQTISSCGALGRLSQHLSETSSNTFKQRICAIFGYESVLIEDVQFAAVKLAERKSFLSRNSDYREAVEAIVNYDILDFVAEHRLGLSVISRVRFNSYDKLGYVKHESGKVVSLLTSWLKEQNLPPLA